jgi:CRP-like cAMP-binding protein
MGSFVGSIAGLLLQSNVRSATVVSIGRAQLGVLDSQRLAMEYTRLSSNFKEIILSLDNRIKQITNRTVEVFSGKKKDVKEVIKGKKVFIKQGDKEDGIYSIDQGNAYVVRSTKRGLFLLCTLEEGDFIGDVPFLRFGHEPNSASIYVTEDFAINQRNRGELENEYEQLSVTFKNMIKNSSGFLSATTKMLCDFK